MTLPTGFQSEAVAANHDLDGSSGDGDGGTRTQDKINDHISLISDCMNCRSKSLSPLKQILGTTNPLRIVVVVVVAAAAAIVVVVTGLSDGWYLILMGCR